MPWFLPAPLIGERLPTQVLAMRCRDRLPTFAIVIENEDGTPRDLTGYSATMSLRPASTASGVALEVVAALPLTIAVGASGLTSYDWQAEETAAVEPGVYDVVIELTSADESEVVTVPTRSLGTIVKFRPAAADGYFARDEQGAFIVDGNGYATLA